MTFESIINLVLKALAIVISSGAAAAAWRYIKAKRAKDAAAIDDAARAVAAAKAAVISALPALVTDAERLFGPGAGALKLSQVTAWAQEKAAALLPDALRQAMPPEWIAQAVDDALRKTRKLWAEKPELIEQAGIISA